MLASVYKKSPTMVFRKIAEECVLVPIRREAADLEKVYTLNDVAAFIWEQIDGTRSVERIVEDVMENFDVAADEAERDVVEYFGLLSSIGAILPCYSQLPSSDHPVSPSGEA